MNARRLFFVALPLCVSGAIGLAFWRVHHPPKTEQHRELQRVVGSCPARVWMYTVLPSLPVVGGGVGFRRVLVGSLEPSEMGWVADQTYVDREVDTTSTVFTSSCVWVEFSQPSDTRARYLSLQLDPGKRAGVVLTDGMEKMKRSQALYPLSVQAWTRFLLAHPRIGPVIRHRLGLQ